MGEDQAEQVGYKKPPKRTQYKKGDHGNPRGRPKGTKNLKTDLAEELAEPIAVKENGRTRKISKQRALLKGVMARAMQGDQKAVNNIFALALKLLADDMAQEAQTTTMSTEDKAVFDGFLRRQLERQQKAGTAA